jgi:hypothetical protein
LVVEAVVVVTPWQAVVVGLAAAVPAATADGMCHTGPTTGSTKNYKAWAHVTHAFFICIKYIIIV